MSSSQKGKKKIKKKKISILPSEIRCPICSSPLLFSEGCRTCPNCGWSACGG